MSSQKRNKKSKQGEDLTKSLTSVGGNTELVKTDKMGEIENLKIENEVLKAENETLKNEKAQILSELEELKREKHKLEVTEKDVNVGNGDPVMMGNQWGFGTENEQDNAFGHTEHVSEWTQDRTAREEQGWERRSKEFYDKPKEEKYFGNKKNNTFPNNDRENEQLCDRGRSGDVGPKFEDANELVGHKRHGGQKSWRRNDFNEYPADGNQRRNYAQGFRHNNFDQRKINERQSRNDCRGEGNLQRDNRNTQKSAKVRIIEENGDLFTAPKDNSLAHCVAADLRMGSGIAVQFKQEFKKVDELLSQRKKVGEVAVLEDKGRYIYYLITKKFSTGKPRLCDLRDSLEDMKKHVEKNNVKNIAIPRLGCGLDRLHWKDVRQLLMETFADLEVNITVYNFTEEMRHSQDYTSKKSSIYITDHLMRLADIECETLLVLFGSECGFVDKTMEEVDEKFKFVNDYKAMSKNLGDVLELSKLNEIICILIVRKHANDLISYPVLNDCFTKLRQIFKKNKYLYMGLSAFIDGDDDLTVAKIVTLLKVIFNYIKCETWICWPEEMKNIYMEYPQRMPSHKDF